MTIITPTTELEAVNAMLRAIGADPVNALTATDDSDIINAKTILSQVSREVQSQGWDFNVDTEYDIGRTVDDEYEIPSNILDIDAAPSAGRLIALVRRGNRLWDQVNHTFTWDVDIKFDVTWLFTFEELPETARNYIAMKACRKFQASQLGSSDIKGYTEQDELDAFTIFKDAESLSADHSIFGNYTVARTLFRWA
jgi:hypothetical protein